LLGSYDAQLVVVLVLFHAQLPLNIQYVLTLYQLSCLATAAANDVASTLLTLALAVVHNCLATLSAYALGLLLSELGAYLEKNSYRVMLGLYVLLHQL
jgi:tryptophan-rich sensory protein